MTGLQLGASAHHDKMQGPCIIPLSKHDAVYRIYRNQNKGPDGRVLSGQTT